jgi:predicted flavoprotein YhiN
LKIFSRRNTLEVYFCSASSNKMTAFFNHIIIGGGAAGFFAALTAKQANPNARVLLLEKSIQLLSKVRISGGGRCNVTHACFDSKHLVQNYPRGNKALIGPFTRFQPLDTI